MSSKTLVIANGSVSVKMTEGVSALQNISEFSPLMWQPVLSSCSGLAHHLVSNPFFYSDRSEPVCSYFCHFSDFVVVGFHFCCS